jgi:ABC-type Fe3+-hydroxamate transport system substrate-binding protein
MLTDALGRTFDFPSPPQRVVSLVPSLTETLFDIGVGESVAGITSYCIFPSGLGKKIAEVGGTNNPKVDAIRELAPYLVYMKLEENLRRHADLIESFARVFVTEPKSVADVEALILQLGMIHGRVREAEERVRELAGELQALRAVGRPFHFAVPIWKNPWMWCGGDTYVSSLVCEAGGVNVFADSRRYPTVPIEEVTGGLKPEIIFLPDEPFVFTEDDARELAASGPRVVGPFPGHLFTWHGTRTVLGLRFLRDVITQK